MNASQLLAHFDRISEAPDAILRLRQFILDLAVRGELVEQDQNDEPAVELLKRLHRGRTHRRTFADLDDPSSLPPIPPQWTWTVVDQISADDENAITDGPFGAHLKTEHYIDTPGFRVIRLQNVGLGTFRDAHHSYIDKARFDNLRKHHVFAGDLIVAGLVDPRVRCCQLPPHIGPALVKADCYRLAVHSDVSPRFALHYLNSSIAQEFAAVHHHGMTLTRIGLGNFRRVPFPMPPLSEQHRIVAKVQELMSLCDRLDATQAEREARRDQLATVCFQRFSQPAQDATSDDLRRHVLFYLQRLPQLVTRTNHVQGLRDAVRNLAVTGRFCSEERWPKEPRRLQELARLQNGYAFKSEWFTRAGVRLVRNINVGHGEIRWGNVACLPLSRAQEFNRFQLWDGDVVLALDRPFIATGTKAARIQARDLPCLLLQRVGRFQVSDDLDRDYLFLWLNSSHFANQIDPGRSNGVPHISSKQVESAGIFAPSLVEQRRVVAKVHELMALCDHVETQLTTGATARRHVLEATLRHALATASA